MASVARTVQGNHRHLLEERDCRSRAKRRATTRKNAKDAFLSGKKVLWAFPTAKAFV